MGTRGLAGTQVRVRLSPIVPCPVSLTHVTTPFSVNGAGTSGRLAAVKSRCRGGVQAMVCMGPERHYSLLRYSGHAVVGVWAIRLRKVIILSFGARFAALSNCEPMPIWRSQFVLINGHDGGWRWPAMKHSAISTPFGTAVLFGIICSICQWSSRRIIGVTGANGPGHRQQGALSGYRREGSADLRQRCHEEHHRPPLRWKRAWRSAGTGRFRW